MDNQESSLLFPDISPPGIPTREQQQDALQKGLGRAAQWATSGLLDSDLLLHACLVDQRFDSQCEYSRGEWLWDLIQRSGKREEFRNTILEQAQTFSYERDNPELFELAVQFAKSGDKAFVDELYKFIERTPVADSAEGAVASLIELEGEAGFRFIAKVRGKELITETWDWHDDDLVERATEVFGESRVDQILDDPTDPDLRRFNESRKQHLRLIASPEWISKTEAEREQTLTTDDVLQLARSEERPSQLRYWGRTASSTDLEMIVEHVWAEADPMVLRNLLRVFSAQPMPRFDPRLIDLCHHRDRGVSHWAIQALGQFSHPQVRQFALQELNPPIVDWRIMSLFIDNFVKGDESTFIERIELPADSFVRHGLLMDLIRILEKNEDADVHDLGLMIYFHTPCQTCRCDAAWLLRAGGSTPDWLDEECRTDSNERSHSVGDPSTDEVEGGDEDE